METTECLRCRHLLSAAMDGEATFNETEFVRKHLGGCPDCREAQQAYNSLRAQLRLLPTPEPPVALRRAVMSRINGKNAVYAGRRPVAGLHPLLAPWQKGVFAAAVLALVFVSGFIFSMLLRAQAFAVEGQPVADTADQKVIIIFTRPVDRNYIMENAPTLFSIKDAENNPLQIDTANIVIEGNRVELPIKRDSGRLQENEQIQVVVAPEIKDDKGAAVSNPGPKVAIAATQAPDVATKTKPGQVVAFATTPVPPASTTAAPTATAPQATAPVVQPNGNPTPPSAPPGSTATPSTTAVTTAAVTATSPATTAGPTASTAPVTTPVATSPTVPATTTVSVSPSPSVPVSTTTGATPSVSPSSTALPPTTPATATVPPTATKTPPITTAPVTRTPVITTTSPAGPSTGPGTLTPSTTVGFPSAVPSTSEAACKPVELGPGFEKLYLDVETRLGCPTSAPVKSGFTYQVFQKGSMLYYQQTGRIYVFYNFGGWATYRATGAVAVPPTTAPTPTNKTATPGSATPDPTGCSLKPRGSFATLWNSNQAVQSSLGCPVAMDSSTSGGLTQGFSRGFMLYNPLASLPYSVVYGDGGFQSYAAE
jgi:hypothetical protein